MQNDPITSAKLDSLSIFFPFYNDEGTVEKQIEAAYEVGAEVADLVEVIAIHGGNSKDGTFAKIREMKERHPDLVVVDKTDNTEGYAVIKYGFAAATKDWIFYTDGDAQYDMRELALLVQRHVDTGADVVNGYKTNRGDGFIRHFLGDMYARFSRYVFELPIRDTDCDFRLIRRECMDKITLLSENASILGEMIKKLEIVGATFVEVPVSHYSREYGISNYTPWGLFKEKLLGDLKLYFVIRKTYDPANSLRIVRFGMVGLSSIVLQAVLFNVFIAVFHMNPAWATILADQFAIVTSYLLNNFYTFHDRKHTAIGVSLLAFAKFYVIVMVATLIQAAIVWTGTNAFGEGILVANFFFVVGLGVTFFWNYSTQKKFVWLRRRVPMDEPAA
ncbi:MAG: bifunctional glycosyltransferase family 2/GtrA family protein [Candidatus Moraniibacteriota bacterium]